MFWIQRYGEGHNSSGYRLFYAELTSDIDKLPTDKVKGTQTDGDSTANETCALGSECRLLEEGNNANYVLTTEGWVKTAFKGNSSSSSSGGDETDLDEITNAEIDALF